MQWSPRPSSRTAEFVAGLLSSETKREPLDSEGSRHRAILPYACSSLISTRRLKLIPSNFAARSNRRACLFGIWIVTSTVFDLAAALGSVVVGVGV